MCGKSRQFAESAEFYETYWQEVSSQFTLTKYIENITQIEITAIKAKASSILNASSILSLQSKGKKPKLKVVVKS